MSWIQDLYDTYLACEGNEPSGSDRLMPIAHTTQQAHIEIVIDELGNFRRASVLPKGNQTTIIPCTDNSGVRSGKKPPNHPLCDKLQYVAGDFSEYGGEVTSGFSKTPTEPYFEYLKMLEAWSNFGESHPKIKAILAYVRKKSVVSDLVEQKVLYTESGSQKLLTEWTSSKNQIPEIFRSISAEQTPEDSFIRWRVEIPNQVVSGTWDDQDLIRSWIKYYASLQSTRGICMVTGEVSVFPDKHPNKIRHAGDKAKLISSNDNSGFTFRGRFLNDTQAAGISFDVTQKAHNALRWIIGRKQAYRNGDQVFVSWGIGGQSPPDIWSDSKSLFEDVVTISQTFEKEKPIAVGDVGQAFSFRLKKAIAGYRATLEDNESIVILGLDSATPGRMAIIFYRKLRGSDFLSCLENWHSTYAWRIRFSVADLSAKKKKRVEWIPSAPSPKSIAEACYGKRLDTKLLKATMERILPSIVDGKEIPKDLVESATRRAANRVGLDVWEWEETLGVACALYKGFYKEREYQMALEKERKTRDYLYGRLLAIGEKVEETALYIAKENRDTAAAKLMQRFGDRPFSTWKTIETSLVPYFSRIKARWPGVHTELKLAIDEIIGHFDSKDFTNDTRLSGEFLLGYHCQRQYDYDIKQKRINDSKNKTLQEGAE